VVDPQANIPEKVARFLEVLRATDRNVLIHRRVEESDLSEIGDFEVIPPSLSDGGGHALVREYRATGIALLGVPFAVNNSTAAFNWAAHYGFDPREAEARQLDAEAARSLQADVFLTDNAYLLHRPSSYAAASAQDAMAVIGLHQRLRNHVVLDTGLSGLFSTWQAEMIQAHAMLHESNRAFSETGSGLPDDATRLVGAATQRLEKALRARDNLLMASAQRRRSFGADSTEDSVERIAIALQGMFDALARALNACLPSPMSAHTVGWHRSDFLRAIPKATGQTAREARFKALRGVVAELRNTVHHEPVGRASSEANGQVEELVTLPRTSAERFLQEADRLERRAEWVAFDVEPYGLALRPVTLCDDIITEAVDAANRIIRSFPWRDTATTGDLDNPPHWLHNPLYAATNRLLYGL
jgi:hypothetical protein